MFSREAPLPPRKLIPLRNGTETEGEGTGVLLGERFWWNPLELPNAHVMMIGASGSGKTQTLKALAHELHRWQPQTKILIIDFHGDQAIEGETTYPLNMSSAWGVNPLKLNRDPEGGGPHLQAITVAKLFKARLQLGPKQEGRLIEILTQVYSETGINVDPTTWHRPAPNLSNLEEALNRLSIGTVRDPKWEATAAALSLHDFSDDLPAGPGLYVALEHGKPIYVGCSINLRRRLTEPHHKLDLLRGPGVVVKTYPQALSWADLLKLETAVIREWGPPFNKNELLPADVDAERIRLKLAATFAYGLFSRPAVPVDAPVTRIDLSKLPPMMGAMAAETLLAQVMDDARLSGESKGLKQMVFCDEAKELKGSPALTRMMCDGRKYGLGLVLASQSEAHLAADLVQNSSTKIVLPVDATEISKVARKFRVDDDQLAKLTTLNAIVRTAGRVKRVKITPYWERVKDASEATQ